jgi:REP element-mobilizing transposase RayT
MPKPLAYFITFSSYGTRLHGSENGSVDRHHNRYGGDLIPPKPSLECYEKNLQKNPAVTFEPEQRQIILETVKEVCAYRNWQPFAIHVRTNHVHVIASSDMNPEKMLHNFQAYATRHLRQAYPTLKDRKIWTRHGSTRYLWNRKKLLEAVHYVVHEQGEHMEYWYDKAFLKECGAML